MSQNRGFITDPLAKLISALLVTFIMWNNVYRSMYLKQAKIQLFQQQYLRKTVKLIGCLYVYDTSMAFVKT